MTLVSNLLTFFLVPDNSRSLSMDYQQWFVFIARANR